MQFGKPEDPGKVDFTLPSDPGITGKVIRPSSGTIQLYTGGTGWGMKDWKGKLYPEKAPVKSFLDHYGQQFRTVELNSLFYNIPKLETIDNWCASVPDDFQFCPKVLQYISHSKSLGMDTDRIVRFQDAIARFEKKLGPSFMQLPPYFDTSRLSILESFLKTFGTDLPLAIEFRHPSWFQEPNMIDRLGELLHRHKKGMVITDVGGRRDVCHMSVTSSYAMIRFVGNNLHASDFERIDRWIEKLGEWFDQGLKKAYFFIHEPNNVYAPELSAYLHEHIVSRTDMETRGPRLLKDIEQIPLF